MYKTAFVRKCMQYGNDVFLRELNCLKVVGQEGPGEVKLKLSRLSPDSCFFRPCLQNRMGGAGANTNDFWGPFWVHILGGATVEEAVANGVDQRGMFNC